MSTSHALLKRPAAAIDSAPVEGGALSLRTLMANVLLALAVGAALTAAAWGIISSLVAEVPPARIGEAVEVSGGFMRVDGVTPEHMAPMQSQKFAGAGMSMSAMGMDMAPEGKRRFAVEVTLAGGEGKSLSYKADDFRVVGDGMKDSVGPTRSQLGAGTVPSGGAASGSMVFEVPKEAKGLEMSFGEGRAVALELPATSEDHSHDGGLSGEDDGHHH